jgi:hypothetical protein
MDASFFYSEKESKILSGVHCRHLTRHLFFLINKLQQSFCPISKYKKKTCCGAPA